IGVWRKRSTTRVPAALSSSYLIGSPPIGTSTMTLTSSGGLFPILMASIRMERSHCCDHIITTPAHDMRPRNMRQTTGTHGMPGFNPERTHFAHADDVRKLR